VVVSADAFNRLKEELVFVVPTTTRDRGKPYHVKIEPRAAGLVTACWAQVEDLRSVSLSRLHEHVGEVDEGTLAEIGEVIRMLMGLP
jgi:mRNA interferase MazF